MGVKHLKALRTYLEQHPNQEFTRTYLRDELRQNNVTITDNLNYLCDTEKVVKRVNKTKLFYVYEK